MDKEYISMPHLAVLCIFINTILNSSIGDSVKTLKGGTTMTRKTRKSMAVIMSLALAASGLAVNNSDVSAAAKVKLSASKATIKVGASKTVTVKGVKASKVKKLSLSTSKKAVATAKKVSNVKFSVTGKKAGKATITAKVTLKKAVAGKKSYKLKFAATVKAVATATEVSAFADLEKTLAKAQASGAPVTVSSTEEGAFTIAKADYSKVDLTINAPKADVINNATFKSVTIKAIKASTYTENAANNVIVDSETESSVKVPAGASGANITTKNPAAKTNVIIEGALTALNIQGAGPVAVKTLASAILNTININAGSQTDIQATEKSKIGSINVNQGAAAAKIDISATTEAAIDNVKATVDAQMTVGGNSNAKTTVEKPAGSKNITVTAPNATVTEGAAAPSPSPTASAAPSPTASAAASPAASGAPSGGSGGSGSMPVVNDVVITFDYNGGTDSEGHESSSVIKYSSPTSIDVPTDVTNPSKILIGWASSAGATTPDICGPGAVVSASSSGTWYAVWATGVKVKYDANGGDGTAPATTGLITATTSDKFASTTGLTKSSGSITASGWAVKSDATAADFTSSDPIKYALGKIGWATVGSDGVATPTITAVAEDDLEVGDTPGKTKFTSTYVNAHGASGSGSGTKYEYATASTSTAPSSGWADVSATEFDATSSTYIFVRDKANTSNVSVGFQIPSAKIKAAAPTITAAGAGSNLTGSYKTSMTGDVTITLSNGTYADSIVTSNFTASLPAGLSISAVERTSATVATVTISGIPTDVQDATAIGNVTVDSSILKDSEGNAASGDVTASFSTTITISPKEITGLSFGDLSGSDRTATLENAIDSDTFTVEIKLSDNKQSGTFTLSVSDTTATLSGTDALNAEGAYSVTATGSKYILKGSFAISG